MCVCVYIHITLHNHIYVYVYIYICVCVCMCIYMYGGFPKLGVPFWGSHNKDYSILGSILGPPILGNYHIQPYIIFGECRATGLASGMLGSRSSKGLRVSC